MKYDLHIHSKYSSDGVLSIDKIIKAAVKKGLDGIAITDHNTIKGGLEAKKFETRDFEVIVGSEIMTERGEIIGLFIKEEIRPGSVVDIISHIKEQDGIIVIPHPFDELRSSSFHPSKEDVKFIDCIEGFNSRCIFNRSNDVAIDFGIKNDLSIIAGSDAHFLNEIGNAGIITESGYLRKTITNGGFKIFGNKTDIVNHVKTKVLKLKRRYAQKEHK